MKTRFIYLLSFSATILCMFVMYSIIALFKIKLKYMPFRLDFFVGWVSATVFIYTYQYLKQFEKHECKFKRKDVCNLSVDPVCKCGKKLSEFMSQEMKYKFNIK